MGAGPWKGKCAALFGLQGVSLPDGVDWKSVYEKKPLGRNLLKNPAPQGTNVAPNPTLALRNLAVRSHAGDYAGWSTSAEEFHYEEVRVPEGVVVCYMPRFSWFTLEQRVDLKAEGLWDELLDHFQPDIEIEDWYEESQVHESIYQLQVQLLGADGQTVISEHVCNPREDLENYSHTWKQVSHTFSSYGPGVRYVHFLHKVKNSFMVEVRSTLVTGSSVKVKPSKSGL
uniref:FBA domain-containing protein n=1 Tax=Denticeps clupeoides TaxID=299321 RepID=A0AAY4EU40_9TELE